MSNLTNKLPTPSAEPQAASENTPPHVMRYTDKNGNSIFMNLCCFCKNLPDLSLVKPCEHAHLVSDIHCPFFAETADPTTRIHELLAAKEDTV